MTIFFLLGTVINTFTPGFLNLGSFTSGMFRDGALPFIGLVLFCSGAQISFRRSGVALYKGSLMTASKVLLGIGGGYLFGFFVIGGETLFSIHPITVITALACGNGGLYVALAERYGDENDIGGGVLVMLTASPFFILIGVGAGGLVNVGFLDILATIVPALIGMILGNLDEDFREFVYPGVRLAIPFFAFALGANISLEDILIAGPQGAFLAALTLLVTGVIPVGISRIAVPARWKRSDSIAAGLGNTAGSGAVVPALIASIDPSFAPYVTLATAQVGASAIITAVACPFMLKMFYQREMQKRADHEGVYL